MKQPKGFTLVELLVVIAIITILAAMLLPTLEKALEASRRTSCAGNLQQQYLAAQTYDSDYNGFLPRPGLWGNDPSTDTNPYRSTTNMRVYDGGWQSAPVYDTAWHIMINKLKLLPLNTTACPSMDFKPASPGILHYDYFYNSYRSTGNNETNYQMRNHPSHQRWPLFNDSASYRLISVLPVVTYGQTLAANQMRWAHQEGGSIAYHDGSVEFRLNFNACANAVFCWPADSSYLRISNASLLKYISGR